MSNDTNDNPSHKSAMLRTACRFASDILLDAWDGDEDGMESNDKNALDRACSAQKKGSPPRSVEHRQPLRIREYSPFKRLRAL